MKIKTCLHWEHVFHNHLWQQKTITHLSNIPLAYPNFINHLPPMCPDQQNGFTYASQFQTDAMNNMEVLRQKKNPKGQSIHPQPLQTTLPRPKYQGCYNVSQSSTWGPTFCQKHFQLHFSEENVCTYILKFAPEEPESKFNGLSWTVDREVHVVHISHVIIAYTLEYLSSLIVRAPIKLPYHCRQWLYISLRSILFI